MRLWRLRRFVGALLVLPLVLSACVVYSTSFGNANIDPAATWDVYFVAKADPSQELATVYFNNCQWSFTCLQNITVPNTTDPIGEEALSDCNAVTDQCGYDEVAAIWARAFDNGGLSAPDAKARCLGFGVNVGLSAIWNESAGTNFAYGSWGWGEPGWWSC
jgi:hypothetical protein